MVKNGHQAKAMAKTLGQKLKMPPSFYNTLQRL